MTATAADHAPVLILGGGSAGISVAARLRRADRHLTIGDAAGLPTSKTGAAVRKQAAPVLVANLLAALQGRL